MPGSDRTRLQGLQYTGVSALFTIITAGGTSLSNLEGVIGMGYEDKRERPVIWGSRRDGRPNGKGAGRYVPGAISADFEEATIDMIISALAAESVDGLSYGDTDFTLQIQLYEPSKPQSTITMNFAGCSVDGDKGDYPTTPDGLKKSMTFMYLSKDQGGKTLFSNSRTT